MDLSRDRERDANEVYDRSRVDCRRRERRRRRPWGRRRARNDYYGRSKLSVPLKKNRRDDRRTRRSRCASVIQYCDRVPNTNKYTHFACALRRPPCVRRRSTTIQYSIRGSSSSSSSSSSSNNVALASTNLVGKFTQSVRRIVQDVKDEGTATTRRPRRALVELMRKYTDSKQVRNVFERYALLKAMIKQVVKLETQYWTLVDIPRQEKQETVPAFVLRACTIMEKSHKSGGAAGNNSNDQQKTSARLAEEAESRRERIDRLENMTISQIEAENTQMTNDLYRLLKKYTGLRNLIKELKEEYNSSKLYPIVPRYTMLKDMIKDIMHNPDYMRSVTSWTAHSPRRPASRSWPAAAVAAERTRAA
ncbi:unnamed protein product [Trichogramma brassicae]|uniref:Uncharacterized protein n=1 Tax=Trichogramma brassicae TaxID=86971 RepID=A0A6H5J264_9HYME|nr:unnamed protein product [Trichogramma brassicae]